MAMLQALQLCLCAAMTPVTKYDCVHTLTNCVTHGKYCAKTYQSKNMCAGTCVVGPVHSAQDARHMCCDPIHAMSKCAGLRYNSEFWCCAHEQTLCDSECCDASSGEMCGRRLEANIKGNHKECCAKEDDLACCAHGIGKLCDEDGSHKPCCKHTAGCMDVTQHCGHSMIRTETVVFAVCAVFLIIVIGALLLGYRRSSQQCIVVYRRWLLLVSLSNQREVESEEHNASLELVNAVPTGRSERAARSFQEEDVQGTFSGAPRVSSLNGADHP